ncbi:MAG: hypothetical protein ACRETI_05395 [Steroidobacteraceae bacterium]
MKLRHIVVAGAALAFAPFAMAAEEAQGTADCASLQAQYDQAAATATAEQVGAAKAARDEGEKLCSEGKSAEGAAKLKEAISQIAAPSQQPSQ